MMDEIQLKYIQIGTSAKGHLYCSGDDLYYFISIHGSKVKSYNSQIKEIYKLIVQNLKLSLKECETNFEIKNILPEIEFLNYDLDNSKNGTIHFNYDVTFYWYDYMNKNISEIILPRGCKVSIHKNDKLEVPINIVLRFYFNLFSNNLLSVPTFGKYERELYSFKQAARINRALVRSIILELKLKHPEMDVEFYNDIRYLTHFDVNGFTDATDIVL